MKPYVLVSPPYDPVSGGIKVMFGLYGHLLARGVEVYMNQYPAGDVVAVYPEIVADNPVGAGTVVRYILNKLGVMSSGQGGGLKEIDPNEHNYYFSRLFGDTNDDHYMFLPVINTNIFKDQHRARDKRAVFVGKGEDLGLHKPGAIIVDRFLARNQGGLADLLNECQVMYCYDPVSAMTEVARLCGCRVVMFNKTYSKEDYTNKYEPGSDGMSFGADPGEIFNVGAFRRHYIGLREIFDKKLDKFLEDTQR